MYRNLIQLPKCYKLYKKPNVFPLIVSIRNTSKAPICPPKKTKKVSHGTGYTISLITVAAVGTIAYAKYDPEFRKTVEDAAPWTVDFFKVVFQEEESLYDYLNRKMGEYVSSITDGISEQGKKIKKAAEEIESGYTAPRAVFPPLAKDEKKEEKFNEIRVQTKDSVEIIQEKPKPKEEILSATHPKNLMELEQQIGEAAEKAIVAYNKAYAAVKDYNSEIELIVETSVDKLDNKIWSSLRQKTETKKVLLKEATDNAESAVKNLDKLAKLVNDDSFQNGDETKATLKRNMERYIEDMKEAKRKVDEEKEMADITEKYWTKVETARNHFCDELEILFPNIDLKQKKLSLSQADLDLFLVHAFANVLYYQKELYRAETIGRAKLRNALEQAKRGDPNFSVIEVHIQDEIDQAKKRICQEYQKKCLELRQQAESELRHRLKSQAEAHQDHLADVVATREQELEREFNRKLDEEISKEQLKYKMQLAGMVGRMKGMRTAIQERIESDKMAKQSQILWSACQALHRAVKMSTPGTSWKEQIKPLNNEINAIRKAAAESDELVQVVLNAIPQEALTRGVFPEDAIRERFLKVEEVARKVALVPETGGRLTIYLLSFLQSFMLVKAPNPIPQCELNDEKTDFSKLDTYDILQRARYWLDRGNYVQTLRYMNLLQGASRSVASEWMKETRILLETQQAAETLMAHAVAGGLINA